MRYGRPTPRLALGLALSTLGAVPGIHGGEPDRELVGSASARIRIEGRTPERTPGPPAGRTSPPRALLPPGQRGEIVDVKLVRVIPIQGNNPLNPREPIRNRDGRIVDEAGGGGGTGGLAGCNGATTAWAASATAPADFRFAGLAIDPNTAVCQLRAGGGGGLALIFQSPASGGTDRTRYEFFTDALEGIWTQTDPAPPLGGTVSLPGTVHTVTLRATSGLTVRVRFVVTGTDTDNYVTTIQSIERL